MCSPTSTICSCRQMYMATSCFTGCNMVWKHLAWCTRMLFRALYAQTMRQSRAACPCCSMTRLVVCPSGHTWRSSWSRACRRRSRPRSSRARSSPGLFLYSQTTPSGNRCIKAHCYSPHRNHHRTTPWESPMARNTESCAK